VPTSRGDPTEDSGRLGVWPRLFRRGSTASKTRHLVVYAAGGGMRAVFGAGALHALSEMGARDHVLAAYGISAGAFNVAHFALGSTTRAMEWYLYHVPEHHILDHATPVGLLRGEDLIDVPEATRVLATEHLIDTESLDRCPLPVRFGVVDRTELSFRWLDARRPDAIRVLLASSTIFPFVHEAVVVDGVEYIDGGYREAVGYHRLRREHPEAELLLLLNDAGDDSIVRRVAIQAVLRRRDEHLAQAWIETVHAAPAELDEALADPRTHVVMPEHGFPVHFATTDSAALAHGHWLGYRAVLVQKDRLRPLFAH
jgi:predicted acylesterase/phospholipase RssA